jgi:hypothetical protein
LQVIEPLKLTHYPAAVNSATPGSYAEVDIPFDP